MLDREDKQALRNTLKRVRDKRTLAKRTRYRVSKLDKRRAEIKQLIIDGASYSEIAEVLKDGYKLQVCRSSVMRYVNRTPELAEIIQARNPQSKTVFEVPLHDL